MSRFETEGPPGSYVDLALFVAMECLGVLTRARGFEYFTLLPNQGSLALGFSDEPYPAVKDLFGGHFDPETVPLMLGVNEIGSFLEHPGGINGEKDNVTTVLGSQSEASAWSDSGSLGLQLVGNRAFCLQVACSLLLLHARSPRAFTFVGRHVASIHQSDRTGTSVFDAKVMLSQRTAFHSLTWVASVLVHEAVHAKQYSNHSNRRAASTVPRQAYFGTRAELDALRYQLLALRQLGAPYFEIEHVRSADGTHWDVDGDGISTWNDWLLQDW